MNPKSEPCCDKCNDAEVLRLDTTIEVRFVAEHVDALAPEYQTPYAAGADLFSVDDTILAPGTRQLISTGLSVEIPQGHELQIRPRSGIALKNGVHVLNSPGTIDADYRGVVKVLLHNASADAFTITKGMRIAQGVLAQVSRGVFTKVDTLSPTERGDGGFGHTGTN